MSLQLLPYPLLDTMSSQLFRSELDEGVATMAVWTLAQLPELDSAFRLVSSATWRLPPLALSGLVAACEARGDPMRGLRLLRDPRLRQLARALEKRPRHVPRWATEHGKGARECSLQAIRGWRSLALGAHDGNSSPFQPFSCL